MLSNSFRALTFSRQMTRDCENGRVASFLDMVAHRVSQSRRQARLCREKCYLILEKKTRGAGRKPGLHTYLLSVQFLPGTSREILLGDQLPEGQDRWVKFPARQGDIFCLPLLNGNIITYQETNSNQCPFFFFCFFVVYPIKSRLIHILF